MRRGIALGLGLASVALLGVAGGSHRFAAEKALAAATWNVQVGADLGDLPGGGGSQTANGYFPRAVTINAGDTVSWTFPSANPHTVTFDNGHQPPLFVEGLSPAPDNSGDLDLTAAALPRGSDGVSAVFDPKTQISSGVPTDAPDQRKPFSVTFNTPGVFDYICAIHGPAMIAQIIVEASGSALAETPAQEQARGKAELGFATGLAQEAVSGNAGPPPLGPPFTVGGTQILPAIAGIQTAQNVSALAFIPGSLTVRRGDVVLFTLPDFQEIHTVSFLSGATPPPLLDVVPSPSGPPKILIRAAIAVPAGGTTYTGSGVLNSGILFSGNTFAVTINAPAGTYEYRCLLHGDAPQNMKGTITVTE